VGEEFGRGNMIIKLEYKKFESKRGNLFISVGPDENHLSHRGKLTLYNEEVIDFAIWLNGGIAFWNDHLNDKDRFELICEGCSVPEMKLPVKKRKLDINE
jgi:hypothetical protein